MIEAVESVKSKKLAFPFLHVAWTEDDDGSARRIRYGWSEMSAVLRVLADSPR